MTKNKAWTKPRKLRFELHSEYLDEANEPKTAKIGSNIFPTENTDLLEEALSAAIGIVRRLEEYLLADDVPVSCLIDYDSQIDATFERAKQMTGSSESPHASL